MQRIQDVIKTAVKEARGREVCGLLLGPLDTRGLISEALVIANVAARPESSFALDPGQWAAAELAAQAGGMAVRGFWHSHPSGRPAPSARDAEGAWPGSLHGIATADGQLAFYRRRDTGLGGAAFELVSMDDLVVKPDAAIDLAAIGEGLEVGGQVDGPPDSGRAPTKSQGKAPSQGDPQ